MSKFAEQITAFEQKRATLVSANEDILSKAAEEGATLDAEQKETFDNNEADIKEIDDHLKRLRAAEKAQASAAKPVEGDTPRAGTESRVPAQIKTTPKLDPGVGFARLAKVKALARLDGESPRTVAKELYGEDSPVFGILSKAAVAAGTTTDSTWAGALVGDETSIFADFVEFLRPSTILGRFGANGIPGLRRVPFRVALIGQTTGGEGYWVGEGKAKPLTKFDFERNTLEPLKVANIAVLTEEVLRDSSPSAEMLVRDGLASALRARLDTDFINPAKTASAGVSPASITNGAATVASTGTDADAIRLDVRALFQKFVDANNPPSAGVWIMSSTTALALSLIVNALGQREFPNIGMTGGTFEGLPVIVSDYVSNIVVLANASDIYVADDGGISVDMSREASLEMDNAPSHDSSTPTESALVSLWQTNSVGFRAERTINWARRRTSAVAYLTGVNWGGAVPAS